jgi:hypothetical protein
MPTLPRKTHRVKDRAHHFRLLDGIPAFEGIVIAIVEAMVAGNDLRTSINARSCSDLTRAGNSRMRSCPSVASLERKIFVHDLIGNSRARWLSCCRRADAPESADHFEANAIHTMVAPSAGVRKDYGSFPRRERLLRLGAPSIADPAALFERKESGSH